MRVSTLLTTATLAALSAAPISAAPQPLEIIAVRAQDMTQSLQNEIFSMLHNPTDYFSSIWGSASSSAQQGWSSAKQQLSDATSAVQEEAEAGIRDVCPDLKVSCVKEGKTVGDIGKKPFCWNRDDDTLSYLGLKDGEQKWVGSKAIGCAMCSPTKNDAECNVKFAVDCAAQCKASGPLGGH